MKLSFQIIVIVYGSINGSFCISDQNIYLCSVILMLIDIPIDDSTDIPITNRVNNLFNNNKTIKTNSTMINLDKNTSNNVLFLNKHTNCFESENDIKQWLVQDIRHFTKSTDEDIFEKYVNPAFAAIHSLANDGISFKDNTFIDILIVKFESEIVRDVIREFFTNGYTIVRECDVDRGIVIKESDEHETVNHTVNTDDEIDDEIENKSIDYNCNVVIPYKDIINLWNTNVAARGNLIGHCINLFNINSPITADCGTLLILNDKDNIVNQQTIDSRVLVFPISRHFKDIGGLSDFCNQDEYFLGYIYEPVTRPVGIKVLVHYCSCFINK